MPQKQMLDAVLNSIADGVFAVHANGRITCFNYRVSVAFYAVNHPSKSHIAARPTAHFPTASHDPQRYQSLYVHRASLNSPSTAFAQKPNQNERGNRVIVARLGGGAEHDAVLFPTHLFI
jgi:hypothetical protein